MNHVTGKNCLVLTAGLGGWHLLAVNLGLKILKTYHNLALLWDELPEIGNKTHT